MVDSLGYWCWKAGEAEGAEEAGEKYYKPLQKLNFTTIL
jgi:hypothetical protein